MGSQAEYTEYPQPQYKQAELTFSELSKVFIGGA